jgi:hypothetical protein
VRDIREKRVRRPLLTRIWLGLAKLWGGARWLRLRGSTSAAEAAAQPQAGCRVVTARELRGDPASCTARGDAARGDAAQGDAAQDVRDDSAFVYGG